MRLHSYVVRYDSGFAPNPFYGFCTLATCKPDIRRSAQIGDWIIGSGSGNKMIKRAGHLVYAMSVTAAMTFQEYWLDARFQKKKPNLARSRMQSCGDNIYRKLSNGSWAQLNSFHSHADGSLNQNHVQRDTGVNRVLVSDNFVYFGGKGPRIPKALRNCDGLDICVNGRGRKVFDDQKLIERFTAWFDELGIRGYANDPTEWVLSP